MSMAQEIDYTTLKWVRNEIDESLDQTRQALEAFVENSDDSTQIRFCATYLHQVYGTLQMVEIYGGALLAEEMEHLAHAIEQGKVQNRDDAFDALMRAIIQLPSYLEHLEQGQQDMPVILLPLLNDLRAARGEHLLSENAFFSPDLKVAPPSPSAEGQKQVEIKKFAKKLRSVYQLSLLGLYRNQDIKNNLKKMGAVLRELINSASSENASRLWWVASGLIEAILQGGLKLNTPIKQLIGQIDPYIKNLITKGEAVFEEKPPHDLLKNLLYYVARSTSEGKRVTQIKAAFNLEQMLPSGNDISEAFNKLRGSNNDLMRSVSAVIKEDLLHIKDQLDVFVRSQERSAADMTPVAEQLSRISDTLAMLGLGDLHKIIQDQITAIKALVSNNVSPSETSLMEIASALLYIESSLEGVDNAALSLRRADVKGDGSHKTQLPDSEKLQLNNLVIKEAVDVLNSVKNSFNAFANDTANPDIISETPTLLNQVRGVLSVLDIDRAANLLHSAIDYIKVELLDHRRQPNQAALDALADVISSVEYFLESLVESRVQPDSLLKVAEQSIARLGITVEKYQHGRGAKEASADAETPAQLKVIEPDTKTKTKEVAETVSLSTVSEPTAVELKTSNIETVEVTPEPATTPQAATAAVANQPEQNIDEEILEIFLEEADEVFAEMQNNLQAWKDNHDNDEALSTLRRSYHTLKGSGRLAGAMVLGEFAWAMENLLNQVLKGKILATPQIFQLITNAEGALTELLKQLKDLSLPIPYVQHIADAADKLADGETLDVVPSMDARPAMQAAAAEEDVNVEQVEVDVISGTEQFEPEMANESFGLDDSAIEIVLEQPAEPESVAAVETEVVIDQPSQDSVLSDIFQKETAAHLANIRDYLESNAAVDAPLVSEPLLRALHTLHGSARMASADDIAAVSEALHRYFRTLNDSQQSVSYEAREVLTRGSEMINSLLDVGKGESHLPADYQELLDYIQNLHEAAYSHSLSSTAFVDAEDSAIHDEFEQEQDTAEDAELIGIFLEEAVDLLGGVGEQLQQWRADLENREVMDEMQRALHTLKGGARMAGVTAVADMSHSMESLLQQLITTEGGASEESHALLLSCHDWLASAIENLRNHQSIQPESNLLSRLEQHIETTFAASTSAASSGQPEQQHEVIVSDETILSDEISLEESSLEQPLIDEPFLDEPSLEVQGFEAHDTSSLSQADESLVVDFADHQEDDEDLLNIFLEEAQEIQENTEHTLVEWQDNINNLDHVAELQRALHTLKGGARMAHVMPVADLSHTIETLLEKINAGEVVVSDAIPALVHECHDWLNVALQQLREQQRIDPANELIQRLEQAANGELAVPFSVEKEEHEFESESVLDDTVAVEEIVVEEVDAVEAFDSSPTFDPTPTTVIEVPDFATASPSSTTVEQPELVEEGEYDEELVEIFLEEAEEIQENTDRILQQWHSEINNKELIAELQRALHTLKGGARMAGLSYIGDLSHSIESLLESVTTDRIAPTAMFPAVVQSCHDWLSHAIDNVKHHKTLHPATELIRQLENLAAGKAVTLNAGADDADVVEEVTQEPAELIELPVGSREISQEQAQIVNEQQRVRNRDEQVRVRADLLDHLVNNASEASIYNSRIGQQLGAWHFNLAELSQTVVRLQEQLRKFEIETEAQIMYRHTNVVNDIDNNPDFDPLELDRFSYMQQLSRGMVESLGDLTSIQGLLSNVTEEADALLLQQSRINTDLQEGLIRTRLTPFSSVLPRLRRIVRQTCMEVNKEAQLKVDGAEGEMDRTQLNRLVPALEHILRNAVDHGIESPDAREKAGKPTYGTINMRFSREGSEVALYITDDGRGINTDAIRKKAIERGLMKKGAHISDNEVTQFILQSGFSTAEQVTQISGRGVGMDVVNTEIKQLNGSLDIETTSGQGSRFTIRLPLTVLTNQALLMSVEEKIYAIPLSNIEHVIRVSSDELGQMIRGEQSCYAYAGNEYEHLDLGRVLHGSVSPEISGREKRPILLCRSGEHRVAMHVEQLVGRQEIVVKSVGPQLSTVNNISGATILPNGEVALILDLNTLIRSSLALKQLGDDELPQQPQFAKLEEAAPTLVMIVDDSITVRKVTERLLKRHNFATITAKDGVDALTQLLETIPDIMLLDVEMPRMDGYELATAIRNDERLKHLPIIMITSRTGDKHRERAMNVGVNMLMGKPYQEHELLENIEALVSKAPAEQLMN